MIKEINNNDDKSEDNKVVVYLIGNKMDLLEEKHEIIKKEEKEKLPKDLGVQYFETSWKGIEILKKSFKVLF